MKPKPQKMILNSLCFCSTFPRSLSFLATETSLFLVTYHHIRQVFPSHPPVCQFNGWMLSTISKILGFLFFLLLKPFEKYYSGVTQNDSQIGFVWWFLMSSLGCDSEEPDCRFLSSSYQRQKEPCDLHSAVDIVHDEHIAELCWSGFSTVTPIFMHSSFSHPGVFKKAKLCRLLKRLPFTSLKELYMHICINSQTPIWETLVLLN